MNTVKSIGLVSRNPQRFSSTHCLLVVAAIALLAALTSTSEQTVSANADLGISDVQKFFPASFR